MHTCFAYVMANERRLMVSGITNNLHHHVWQYKVGAHIGASRSGVPAFDKLVFFLEFTDIREAYSWERAWRRKSRAQQVMLIRANNPTWQDLAWDWFAEIDDAKSALANRGEAVWVPEGEPPLLPSSAPGS